MRKRTAIAGLCVGVFMAAIVWGCAAAMHETEPALAIDSNAVTGVMPGVDREQRVAELQEKLDQSEIAFSVNTNPVFADGTAEGNVMIENPQQNAKLLVAEIYLDKTDELIYQSKAIQPGSYIEEVKLNKDLKKGVYPATIYLMGYTEDSQEYIGKAGAEIQINIEN